jgi:hypothetical protein
MKDFSAGPAGRQSDGGVHFFASHTAQFSGGKRRGANVATTRHILADQREWGDAS